MQLYIIMCRLNFSEISQFSDENMHCPGS